MKLPFRGLHLPLGAHELLSRLWRLALSPHYALLRGICFHFINDALTRSVQRCVVAARGAESSPGGSSSNALDVTTAKRARAPPQLLLMVAKCSVMIGGHKVSSRRLLGRPGPKSGSAGSRWRPQHTRKSRAARAMTPVLQDKPHHSTDLTELVPTNILHYYLLIYCALCGKRPVPDQKRLGRPLT